MDKKHFDDRDADANYIKSMLKNTSADGDGIVKMSETNKDVVVDDSSTDDAMKENVIVDDGKYLPTFQEKFITNSLEPETNRGALGTNIKIKREQFEKFTKLIRNQFEHGGIKYKDPDARGREFTDLICDSFPGESGVDWVLGTMMKYLGRFKQFQREKDLLKVATYCYIVWLKFGFHLDGTHDEDIFTR